MSNKQAELQLQGEFNYHFIEFLVAFLAMTVFSSLGGYCIWNLYQTDNYSIYVKVSAWSTIAIMIGYCLKVIISSILRMVKISDELSRARKTKWN